MEKLFWCWIFPSSVAGSLAVGTTRLFQPLLKKLYVDDQRLISILSMMFFVLPMDWFSWLGKRLSFVVLRQPVGQRPSGEVIFMETTPVFDIAVGKPIFVEINVWQKIRPLLTAIALLWAVVMVVGVLWQLCQYRIICKKLDRIAEPLPDSLKKALEEIATKKNISVNLQFRSCDGIATPLLVGLIHPTLYIPLSLTKEELTLALCHELAHLQQGDLWLKAIVQTICCIHWFNPICNYQARWMEHLCEMVCDRKATEGMDLNQRKQYGMLLLHVAQAQLPVGVVGMSGRATDLKWRLEELFQEKKPNLKQKLCVLICLAMAFSLTACAGANVSSVSQNNLTVLDTSQTQTHSSNFESGTDLPQSEQFLQSTSSMDEKDVDKEQDSEEEQKQSFSQMVWPVPSYKIVSRQIDETHTGTDLVADKGESVLVMMDGTVEEAKFDNAYGNYVKVNHGNGEYTLYAHMDKIQVQQGQQVEQGDTIGTVGSTAYATGNHCHVEWILDGKYLNLEEYFDIDN